MASTFTEAFLFNSPTIQHASMKGPCCTYKEAEAQGG